MIYPRLNKLVKKSGSRYALVIATAKRARQLSAGEAPLVDCKSSKSVTVAINELASDSLNIVNKKPSKPTDVEISAS